MTQNNTHDRDDERLAQLLRIVDADVPSLDRERLDALAEQSADAFVGRALLPVIPPKRAGEPEGVSPRTIAITNVRGLTPSGSPRCISIGKVGKVSARLSV